MAKRTLIGFDGEGQRATYYAEEDGKTYVEMRQDCSHLIAAAKVLAEVPPRKEDGWRFLGLIPDTVLNQAMIDGKLEDKAYWRAWLNNSDNRAFNGGRSSVS